jgi:hypothetical protein
MSKVINLELATPEIRGLVHAALTEPVVFCLADCPVATLQPTVGEPSATFRRRVPGLLKGRLSILAEDDGHLLGFDGYEA